MAPCSDARDPELISPSGSGRGASSACRKKGKLENADVIDITESCAGDGAVSADALSGKAHEHASHAALTPELASSGDYDDDASGPLDDLDDSSPDVELVENSFDDDLDSFADDDVIDLGSNLPAISTTRLPSVAVRDNLQSYLREVSRFPLLDPEEETTLARRVRDTGDPEAAFRIISSHLRLVVRIAMDFQRRWMQNVLDLIQEGNVGLLRAVNKFDPDKGIKFSYYASFWIKAYILKFIMDNWRMVKIGTTQAQRKLFYNLNRERQKLILQGFDPDAALLSQRLGVTQDQVLEMQQRLDASDSSLDAPVNDESGSASRMDFLPALGPSIEDGIAGSEIARLVRESIEEMLPSLSEKEVYILENRLLTDEPATLREIGERYNVTRERIRQLEARLLEKLKDHLGRELRDFSEDWISE